MSHLLSVTGRTDRGRIRRRNEDAYELSPEHGVAVVADGMGGHPAGDYASRLAADTATRALVEAVESRPADADFFEYIRPLANDAVLGAHRAIVESGREDPEREGMGTTLTALVVDRDSGSYLLGHVGDSRAYRVRDGALEQLTRDDTWIQQQIDRGVVDASAARTSPYAHLLTQCLGLQDEPRPQTPGGETEPGDTFLLCTDGLVGMLDDDEIGRRLAEHTDDDGRLDIEAAADALVAAANEAGGHDNITAALVRVG